MPLMAHRDLSVPVFQVPLISMVDVFGTEA